MKALPFRSLKMKLLLFSVMHLVTDGLCAYLVFSKLYTDDYLQTAILFFAYNILAFVTQAPVGILIDKYNKPKIFLAISIGFMVLGYVLSDLWYLSVIFIGISNSLFHVAGGRYITDKSGNDISHLGIFVSTGAIGLVLGQRYLSFTLMPYIFFTLLIVCGLIVIFSEDSETKTYSESFDNKKLEIFALFAIVAVVVIRSFVGKVVSPDFTLSGHLFLVVAIATALGKAMGGVLSKLFGVRLITYISMIAAALCLTLGAGNIYVFVLGVFAFNFSMPITLCYANIMLRGHEGFAFGTLAASLTPGYFFAMIFDYSLPMRIIVAIMCLVSMFTIIIISKRIKKL